jgi:cytoskeleton protein RodZ
VSLFQRIKTPFTESGDDEMAPPRPRPRPVGEILRERREELELDLDRVGEILRIKPAYLAALEQGRPQDLPGPTYVIGFVRAYAHHLGLDAERVLERYKAESTDVHTRPDLSFPVALSERSVPGGPILLVALILAICGYGTWYYLSTDERSRPERVTAVPPSLQMPPAPGTADPDASASTAPAKPSVADTGTVNTGAAASPRLSSGLFPTPDAAMPADSAGAAPSQPIPPAGPATTAPAAPARTAPPETASPASAGTARAAAPPQQVASAAPQASPAETKTPADAGGSATGRIEIRAMADCWVQVRAADQAIIFSRVLKSGETYHVPGQTGLFLRTGNAGALAITVDGKPAPSIGAIGTLRRNVALDPDELIGGTAVHG